MNTYLIGAGAVFAAQQSMTYLAQEPKTSDKIYSLKKHFSSFKQSLQSQLSWKNWVILTEIIGKNLPLALVALSFFDKSTQCDRFVHVPLKIATLLIITGYFWLARQELSPLISRVRQKRSAAAQDKRIENDSILSTFKCQLTNKVPKTILGDPSGKAYYDADAIHNWLADQSISPVTGDPLSAHQLVGMPAVQAIIDFRRKFLQDRE